ncbi:hypothetical protein SEUCBS140593_008150 [Sporothrix eucalyptigena]|uniref:N-acetyltransferase domain-containing protein n=1 Tax=Sporothrix eucalyptigena TaxID=1812306 RepID=A0ABP0CKH8_9PEZI
MASSQSENVSFHVVPATEADMETAARLVHEAISPTSPIDSLLHPLGMTDGVFAAAVAGKTQQFRTDGTIYRKVVASRDSSGDDEMVAFTRLYIRAVERNESEWNTPFTFTPDEGLEPGELNVEAANAIFGPIDAMKKKAIRGSRHLYISLFAASPDWQGKGLGRLLMEDAFSTAKAHGLDTIYLISTESARPFYAKFDYEMVDTVTIDLVKLRGGSEGEKTDKPTHASMMLLRKTPV